MPCMRCLPPRNGVFLPRFTASLGCFRRGAPQYSSPFNQIETLAQVFLNDQGNGFETTKCRVGSDQQSRQLRFVCSPSSVCALLSSIIHPMQLTWLCKSLTCWWLRRAQLLMSDSGKRWAKSFDINCSSSGFCKSALNWMHRKQCLCLCVKSADNT